MLTVLSKLWPEILGSIQSSRMAADRQRQMSIPNVFLGLVEAVCVHLGVIPVKRSGVLMAVRRKLMANRVRVLHTWLLLVPGAVVHTLVIRMRGIG